MNDINEIAKYMKKTKHHTPKKLKHKHNKIECIVEKHFIFGNKPHTLNMLGWYCDICGKVKGERIVLFEELREKYSYLEVKEMLENE